MDRVKIVNRAQHETIIKLIESVKKYPILYNSKRADYRDVELKKKYWQEVQADTSLPSVEECQKLWKTLRDRFIRETRALENNGKLGDGADNSSVSQNAVTAATGGATVCVRWPYYEALLFYKNCGRSPRTYLSSSSVCSSSPPSRRTPPPSVATLNSSGEDNNTSSSVNSNTSSTEDHNFPSHQAFIEAVFRQARTRLESPSPSSSHESIPLSLARTSSSPNLSHRYCPTSPPVSVAVVRPISPGALVNATSSMALVSRESSVQSIYEECDNSQQQHNDSASREMLSALPPTTDSSESDLRVPLALPQSRPNESSPNERSRCHILSGSNKPDEQALNLSTHNKQRSTVREPTGELPEPKKQKTSDEDELFALSLVPSLKRLGARLKTVTKIKILQQLAMAEFSADEKQTETK